MLSGPPSLLQKPGEVATRHSRACAALPTQVADKEAGANCPAALVHAARTRARLGGKVKQRFQEGAVDEARLRGLLSSLCSGDGFGFRTRWTCQSLGLQRRMHIQWPVSILIMGRPRQVA